MYEYLEIPSKYSNAMIFGKIGWFLVEFYNFDATWGRIKDKFESLAKKIVSPNSLLLKKEEKSNRLHHLDSCRGIACAMVAVDHFLSDPWTSPDFIGEINSGFFRSFISTGGQDVQFFLALSGYVLAMVYWKPKRCSDLYKMLMGRATRFYPLHWVLVIFAVSVVHYWTAHYNSGELRVPEFEDVVRCLTLTQNWDYYGNPRLSAHEVACNTVSWSLSVEWLVNIVMFICIRYLPVYICLPVFELITYVGYYGGNVPNNVIGGQRNHGLFYAFFLGVFTYQFTAWAKVRYYCVQLLFDVACMMHVRSVFTEFDAVYTTGQHFWDIYESMKFDMAWNSCIFIYLLENSFVMKRFLSLKPFTFLGKISFALYLSHVNLLRFWRIMVAKGYQRFDGYNQMFQVFTIFCLFATFLHYKVELPAKANLDIAWGIAKPRKEEKAKSSDKLPLFKNAYVTLKENHIE